MGSKGKAKEFLEVSQTHEHYSTIIENTLMFFIATAEQENKEFAEYLKKMQSDYKDQFANAIDMTELVYAEIFSDDELEELIVMHQNPVLEKLRGLTSEISQRTIEKYVEGSQ